jgi:hypothetical protein
MDYFDDPFTEARQPSGYDTAQFCANGHCITTCSATSPEFKQDFCSRCGEKTLTSCPNCSASIRGYFHIPGVFGSTEIHTPSFCHKCGKPYPWVALKVTAGKELVDEFEGLNADERMALKGAIDDLIVETPRTQVAIVRVKKFLPKVGKAAADAFRKIMIEVMAEAVKKQLYP